MSEIWAAAAAVVGAGATLYGSAQQRKANSQAQDQNARLQEQSNSAAWSNYLLSRGISPTVQLAPGQMPQQGEYRAVNSRLPYWANVNLNQIPAQSQRTPFLVKRGGA